MDDDSIDRIIAATTAADGGNEVETQHIDREGLRKDLVSVETVHVWATYVGRSSPAKQRRKRRSKIARMARELSKLLDEDRNDDGAVGMFYPRELSDYVDVASAVGRSAEQALEPLEPLIYGDEKDLQQAAVVFLDGLASGSAFEASIARLMFVFEKHFESRSGYTKKEDDEDGYGPSVIDSPFVDFAEQTLHELGITKNNGERHSRQTISTAVTHVRKGGRRSYLNRRSAATDKS